VAQQHEPLYIACDHHFHVLVDVKVLIYHSICIYCEQHSELGGPLRRVHLELQSGEEFGEIVNMKQFPSLNPIAPHAQSYQEDACVLDAWLQPPMTRVVVFLPNFSNFCKSMLALASLLSVLFFAQTAAFYSGSDVIELSEAEFKKQVLKGDEVWLVEFYAPW
jgi:hypothetical protein